LDHLFNSRVPREKKDLGNVKKIQYFKITNMLKFFLSFDAFTWEKLFWRLKNAKFKGYQSYTVISRRWGDRRRVLKYVDKREPKQPSIFSVRKLLSWRSAIRLNWLIIFLWKHLRLFSSIFRISHFISLVFKNSSIDFEIPNSNLEYFDNKNYFHIFHLFHNFWVFKL